MTAATKAAKPAAAKAAKAAPAAAAAPAAVPAEKRRPGRPPKKQPVPMLQKNGIVETPSDSNNRLEFVYGDPGMVKSLFTYFTKLKASILHLRCTPKGLTFFTHDGTKKCRIVADLPGAQMNHYYCDDTFWVGLKQKEVERIFSSSDKSFFKVTFLYRHDDPDNFVVIFKDAEIDKECNYRIGITTLDSDETLYEAEALLKPEEMQKYKIDFSLTAKQFKKTVVDAHHLADTITVEKLGTHNLQLTYLVGTLAYNEVYRSDEKISLRSEVKDGEIFRCTVTLSELSSLANAMVTDTVRIYCREDGDMLLRSEIDALSVSTFVPLS